MKLWFLKLFAVGPPRLPIGHQLKNLKYELVGNFALLEAWCVVSSSHVRGFARSCELHKYEYVVSQMAFHIQELKTGETKASNL